MFGFRELRLSPHASHLGLANDKELKEFKAIFAEAAGILSAAA